MRHHIVQEAYLRQWADKENQLNIYSIFDKKIIERGPNWKGFWKDDYNVLDKEDETNGYDYFPEDLTALIDSKGLDVIKKLETLRFSLNGHERSCVAFYLSLQYLRSPRRRDEFNDLTDKTFKTLYKDDFIKSFQDDFDIDKLINKEGDKTLKSKIKTELENKSIEEIKKETIDYIKSERFSLQINNTGHSKMLIKNLQRIPKEIFYFKWDFLTANKDTSFITSDNPCFTVSDRDIMAGILSDNVKTYFPLTPNICLRIEKGPYETTKENVLNLSKKEVKAINLLILSNCYNSIIAKDKVHIENIIKGYNFSLHKKSKNIKVYNDGEYFLFNLE